MLTVFRFYKYSNTVQQNQSSKQINMGNHNSTKAVYLRQEYSSTTWHRICKKNLCNDTIYAKKISVMKYYMDRNSSSLDVMPVHVCQFSLISCYCMLLSYYCYVHICLSYTTKFNKQKKREILASSLKSQRKNFLTNHIIPTWML